MGQKHSIFNITCFNIPEFINCFSDAIGSQMFLVAKI